MKKNHCSLAASSGRTALRTAAAAGLALLLAACPMPNPDPPPDNGPSGSFSWASPDTPKESSFTVASLIADAGRHSRAIVVHEDSKGIMIEPSSFLAAYSYIGLVPEGTVADIVDTGIQIYRDDSDWIRKDDDSFKLDDPALIPGYWAYRTESEVTLFEVYVDEDTPVTRNQVQTASFPIYDSSEHAGELKIFDVLGGSTRLVLEDRLPEDLTVNYTGVAAELIYYEVELEGYGRMQFFFNDHPGNPEIKAGDVLVHKESFGADVWKWAYLKHGDGPDPACFLNTGNNPGYHQVNTPDDPDNPGGDWSLQPYNGLAGLDGAGPFYTYLYDAGPMDFSDGSYPNGGKRPSGAGSFSYWMTTNEIMNGPDPSQGQFTTPALESALHVGGFKNADLEPFGDYPSAWYEGELDFEPDDLFLVHHEGDYHLGPEDRTTVAYYDSRQQVLTRNDLLKQYGWYGYDSGLLSTIYDDSNIIGGTSGTGGSGGSDPLNPYEHSPLVLMNPLYFAIGRMQVYADAPPGSDSSSGPAYTDSWFDRIISMHIELQLEAELRTTENNVSEADFEQRFLTFFPDWTAPHSPPARPRSFNGSDDLHKPPIKFMIIPAQFKINHHYLHYSDAFTMTPKFHPDPLEGPFTDDVLIALTGRGDDDDVRIFYTTNGNPPIVEGDAAENTLTAGADTLEYLQPFSLLKADGSQTVKAVSYEIKRWDSVERKEASLVKEGVYNFSEPGFRLEIIVEKLGAVDESEVWACLFGSEEIDLNSEQTPLYASAGPMDGGGCHLTLQDVPGGTYYLCVLIDGDGNGMLSEGDAVYPIQAGEPDETFLITPEQIILDDDMVLPILDSGWMAL